MHIHTNISLWMHLICLYSKIKHFCVSLDIQHSIFLKKKDVDMRFYFTLYGILSALAFLLPPRWPRSDDLHFFYLVPVIYQDLMSKMSAVIRRIINTTNAPAAIGPYR